MATAAAMCKPHASEARRPEAGSRAVGVSRAERGNDESPSGARRRRRLDAKHDSATGHVSWPGTHRLQRNPSGTYYGRLSYPARLP